ncbi:MAG: phosphoenolpyruvate synthase [Gammaproteobacteria bacterium]|nr:MAG: phosphoenolpyruvate synthase [Gammaproteobacteria bacterium]
MTESVIWLDRIGMDDVAEVGGKNASLGEMISNLSMVGVRVPTGFATTAEAYRTFLQQDNLSKRINKKLASLDIDDVSALAKAGAKIRKWIVDTPFPDDLQNSIIAAFTMMQSESEGEITVAVRSSATAEDLPDASFAGQQETFLNVNGLDNVLTAIKHVFASLYNDRAIAYREHQGFDHEQVALSAGIQHMVRSDIGASGVIFTLDTESGFRDAVFITGSWGLGETVVQGAVNPDEFHVYKPALAQQRSAILSRHLGAKAIKMVYTDSTEHGKTIETVDVDESDRNRFCLTDDQVETLANYAVIIEQHYDRPMDIEWALDGEDDQLYILQARPETVESRNEGVMIEQYELKEQGKVLTEGRAIGQRIGSGTAKVIMDVSEMSHVESGNILVTDMTDPDWEPIMKKAAAIVTNRGGRTCHAAIIAREMGIPAIVGCGDATEKIKDGIAATVSCAEGDTGFVYDGLLDFELTRTDSGEMPELPVKIMMNIADPGRAFAFSRLPNAGIGLARLEFIINNTIGIHPKALLDFDNQPDEIKQAIRKKIAGYAGPVEFYINKLTEGISTLAAAFAPEPIIVRMSDFKSNEYANLLGGRQYEPEEENPMIGFRGASRYVSDEFRSSFELECQAIKKARNDMGLTNIEIMIPFCRTTDEAREVIELLAQNGLERNNNGLRIIMMCEIPSNAVLAEEFLEYFDGYSIGSNDMTQLVLGLDRDSELVANRFDERNPAVKKTLSMAIQACRKQDKYIGICGQGPSDYPDFAEWLLQEGITSISLNPDTVVSTWLLLGKSTE